MKRADFLIILLLGLFCFCCKGKDYYRDISDTIASNLKDSLKRYDMVVVIPGSGCTGCISSAEHFFIENVNNRRIKFILTYNFSKKNLILRLGKENINQSNVLIDNDNDFYRNQYEEKIYPVAVMLNEGKITKVDKLDHVMHK